MCTPPHYPLDVKWVHDIPIEHMGKNEILIIKSGLGGNFCFSQVSNIVRVIGITFLADLAIEHHRFTVANTSQP